MNLKKQTNKQKTQSRVCEISTPTIIFDLYREKSFSDSQNTEVFF